MKILLTNDDGYSSDGLQTLAAVLRSKHEICILAPDIDRSGVSQALSLRNPITIKKIKNNDYTCSGTPADCVVMALHGAVGFMPDIVVSGINRGPNLGTDLIYSGTAAAARQAAMAGIVGIAVSLATYKAPYQYEALSNLILKKLDYFIKIWNPEVFININAPNAEPSHKYDIEYAKPSRRIYSDVIKFVDGPDNHSYGFFSTGSTTTIDEVDSDAEIVARGKAAVSKIFVYPLAQSGE